MFKFLKDKLKSWAQKVRQETEEPLKKPLKKPKKQEKQEKPEIPQKEKRKEKRKETKQKEIAESLEKETDKQLTKQLYEPEIEEIQKTGFFDRFKKKLTQEKFDELFQDLELILLQNNVAYEVVNQIRRNLEEKLISKNLSDVNIPEALKDSIKEILLPAPDFLRQIKSSLAVKQPFVIAFVGINGSGKTTTIAKIANFLKKNKLSVCLAAADTFRAASIEQLQKHADNLKIQLIKKDYGADPASIGFDAVNYAKKHHIDVVLIDTAGRMNTKDSLMKEMEKIMRVNKPDMKIFIGESITGNDATQQAKDFNDSIDITGIILSKADVDEKGGAAISVSFITKKPILFLGTGQSYNDLEVFNKDNLIEKIGL